MAQSFTKYPTTENIGNIITSDLTDFIILMKKNPVTFSPMRITVDSSKSDIYLNNR